MKTTQRDLDFVKRNPLEICNKCGWVKLRNHAERCDPARGRVATKLIESLPEVSAGKLGYGDHSSIFDLSKDLSIAFNVGVKDVRLKEVILIGKLSVDEAADLVRAIKGWQNATIKRRKRRKSESRRKRRESESR
jgi:hypothetical protein